MDFDEYRIRGKIMVDYIADYLETIRQRRVYPNVHPGYLRNLTPDCAPVEPESWDHIMDDVENIIMPGITHWQSPQMHAYFPALNSFPSLLGDMLADAINCLGFTWASSPACTELEIVVMNWLGKMIGLPEAFLHTHNESKGGGVIQTTSSEATFVCLLAARTQAIRRIQEVNPELEDVEINSRLVAYCSDQAHSSVEKAGLIGLVKMRFIESDDSLSLRGAQLIEAIVTDKKQNLIPFFLCATLGTTGACAFDKLEELGPICNAEDMWFHVDAAYAGTAFICPEFRHWLTGIAYADSIAFNPSKWMMVHFDCTAMWVKNSECLHRTFNVDPLYLQHENSGLAIDYMHWQIPLSKRFRALKLWFVIRCFGIKGLQKHIREGVQLAKKFELLVINDKRFEIPAARHLGLVVFRLRGENHLTERLLKRLNFKGRIHCVPASLKGKYVIRFTITSQYTTISDITRDWAEIKATATEIINDDKADTTCNKTKVSLADNAIEELRSKAKFELNLHSEFSNFFLTHRNKVNDVTRSAMSPVHIDYNESENESNSETRNWNNNFGASLLLANSPMSPKVVNGSFAALFDNGDDWSRKLLRSEMKDSSSMRRRIRGILMSGKQFSLDSRMDLFQGQGMVPSASKKAICMAESISENSTAKDNSGNTLIENDEIEENGEPKNPKPRIFRHTQHETSLTPLIESNTTDLID